MVGFLVFIVQYYFLKKESEIFQFLTLKNDFENQNFEIFVDAYVI